MYLNEIKEDCLVIDIETWAEYDNGNEVHINSSDYIDLAKIRWFGAYSYKDNKEYYLDLSNPDNIGLVKLLLQNHSILIHFNGEEFDFPIIKNNSLVNENKWYTHVDCMKILASSKFKDKNGYKYKDHGSLMGFSFPKKSLECMASIMDLDFQKSTIDYKIFKKTKYTDKEKNDIIKYLKNDVMATKGLFDKLWNYWKPFTYMLDDKSIKNLSWIRSSIASLIYKSICNELGTEPTYSDSGKKFEEMGGHVILPKYEEAKKVWYLDVSSLYPHVFCMFNLFAETSENNVIAWHGNEHFKVKGYYDISYQPKTALIVQEKLKQRLELDKDDPMAYTLKIFLNGLYGIVRSPIFEKVHTPNAGWDVCWLGQQIQKIIKEKMNEFGFEEIAGDTDSIMLIAKNEKNNNKEYVEKCINKILLFIYSNVPFPIDTFNIKIENYLDYILFPFHNIPLVEEEIRKKLKNDYVEGYIHALDENDKKIIIDEKTGKIVKKGTKWTRGRIGLKKNYLYIYHEDGKPKIEIVGLPIKKDNATDLGLKIFNEVLKPLILKNKRAKFSLEFIENTVSKYLKEKNIMNLISREFKVKPCDSYKVSSGIHAQISKQYFNGKDGVIRLVKNYKIGKVGKSAKYCSVKEAIDNQLTIKDLELDKLWNELEPFIEYKK